MSLKSLFILVTLAAILCMLIRESIQQATGWQLVVTCTIASGLGFAVGLLVLRRPITISRNWLDIVLWTIIPPFAACVGWLPNDRLDKVLPLTIIGSIFVVILATIGAGKSWPDEECQ